jgi:CRISPR-associated protein Csb2
MTQFAIAVEYLTGYAVASDHANREMPEWPPHPARVFMALAAAHFETDDSPENKRAERNALEWLAALAPPALALPPQARPMFASPRQSLTVYVPVNDATGIDVLPTKRSRQPRMFPRVFVGEQPIRLVWTIDERPSHLDALVPLCRKVTRIGHSSSLVWARLERDISSEGITHTPSSDSLEHRLRVTGEGALGHLEHAYNGKAVEDYHDLDARIVKVSDRKSRKALQQELAARFPLGKPMSRRPSFSMSCGYNEVQVTPHPTHRSRFDPNLIVLKEADETPRTFGLESTLLIAEALRGLIQKECGIDPIPDWISGHNGPGGQKLADGRGHIALFPLPFVQQWRSGQRQYADGHIMGMAIAVPREVASRDRARALGQILFDQTNQPRTLKLTLGRAGEFYLVRETSFSMKHNIKPRTWTEPSRHWASVTPVVLDRVPKTDRKTDCRAWNEEVAGLVCSSCANQDLPQPLAVRVEKTPFFVGSLRAMPGQGGFPQYRPGSVQVHVDIEFDVEVEGPILLGAGRFRGYGLCRPIREEIA